MVQLHGDPSADDIYWLNERITATVWPVVRVEGTSLPATTLELAEAAGAVLLDAKVVGQLGGTGVALNWAELRGDVQRLRDGVPYLRIILAGGLRTSNLQNARDILAPEVVDVSSGIEIAPGIKDAAAMEAFIKAGRTTAQNTGHE